MNNNRKHTSDKSLLNAYKLDYMLELTQLISKNAEHKLIYAKFEYLLREKLYIGKALLIVKELNIWKKTIHYGFKNEYFQIDIEKSLLPHKEIITIDKQFELTPFDFLIPIIHKSETLGFLLLGDLDDDAIQLSATIKHLNYLQTTIAVILIAIENSHLSELNITQSGIDRDMKMATEVHNMLFPKKLPFNKHVKFSSYYLPHHFIGGDYYDVFPINENEYIFCIADVSGKGISAALLTANLQANLHAITNFNTSLSEVVIELNNKIINLTKGDRFITLFIAKYNITTHVLSYINAGHLPVFIYSKSYFEQLKIGSVGIGMFDQIPDLMESTLLITEPTNLFLYTDGVIETENNSNDQFGELALESFLKKDKSENIILQNNKVVNLINTFREKKEYKDDITILNCLLE